MSKLKNLKFFIREYKIIKQIGEGSYASIYKVQKDNSNEIYVLKQIPITEEDLNDTQNLNNIKNESLILSKIHSPYIVKFYDSFFHNNSLNIITEFCTSGDLCDYIQMYIQHKKKMSEKLIWKLFIQICLGLHYLHNHKILHRDIKTKNIFLNEDFSVKIGDLGIAKILENTTSYAHTFIGTPYYLSPELCKDLPYNDKSDVWSLGCVLYEMVTLKHPFEAKTRVEIYDKIINGNYEGIDKYYSLELRRMIDLLLIKDEKKRPKICEILSLGIIKEKAKECGIKIPEIKPKNYLNKSNNSKNVNESCNSINNNNSNNNFGGSNESNFNNLKNNQMKIKINNIEVNYNKNKNENYNNKHKKIQIQQNENSGRNSSKLLDISSKLKQSQEKILNMLSKRKSSSKENNQNRENINNNNNIINNNINNNNINDNNQILANMNKIQINLKKKNNINHQRPISGNINKRNIPIHQKKINNLQENNYYNNNDEEDVINYIPKNANLKLNNNKSLKNLIEDKENESNSSVEISNNEVNIKNISNHEINSKNNISNNHLNIKNFSNHEINSKSNISNYDLNNIKNISNHDINSKNIIGHEINSKSNISNLNINILNNNNQKIKNLRQMPLNTDNNEDKKKTNIHDIIQKMRNNPMKKNIEINQKNEKINFEDISIIKRDSNNFTLTENKDMVLFNTNVSEKNNLKINEEKVKVFNANDTIINKTESQLKKDTINLLNLKQKYLNLLNECKNIMIEISEKTFENVLTLYKKIDSNPNDIDIIYEEIQKYISENITQDNDNDNLYKKFNKSFCNYIYYEIELKDVEKKIEKRKNNSKWFINQ